jgi:hypothetical protein
MEDTENLQSSNSSGLVTGEGNEKGLGELMPFLPKLSLKE